MEWAIGTTKTWSSLNFYTQESVLQWSIYFKLETVWLRNFRIIGWKFDGSFKLLVYKHEDKEELEEIGMDINLNPVFLTAVEMIYDGRHIAIPKHVQVQWNP